MPKTETSFFRYLCKENAFVSKPTAFFSIFYSIKIMLKCHPAFYMLCYLLFGLNNSGNLTTNSEAIIKEPGTWDIPKST